VPKNACRAGGTEQNREKKKQLTPNCSRGKQGRSYFPSGRGERKKDLPGGEKHIRSENTRPKERQVKPNGRCKKTKKKKKQGEDA